MLSNLRSTRSSAASARDRRLPYWPCVVGVVVVIDPVTWRAVAVSWFEHEPLVHASLGSLTLVAVCHPLMAVIASVSGLNVAQQEFAVAFDASQTTVLWTVNVYTLTLAALLLPFGALGDRIGRRPALLVGLVLFGAASAAAGLATSSEMMIAARLLAGAAAALIMPLTLAVITSTFSDEERSQAIGVWSGVAGAGGLLGVFVSALLVDVTSWRWLFALPVALVAVALVLSARAVPNSTEHGAAVRHSPIRRSNACYGPLHGPADRLGGAAASSARGASPS